MPSRACVRPFGCARSTKLRLAKRLPERSTASKSAAPAQRARRARNARAAAHASAHCRLFGFSRRRPRSNSEPRPALGSARVDDRASRFGFHAHAKAVRALAARFRWLVSSLHDDVPRGWPKNRVLHRVLHAQCQSNACARNRLRNSRPRLWITPFDQRKIRARSAAPFRGPNNPPPAHDEQLLALLPRPTSKKSFPHNNSSPGSSR